MSRARIGRALLALCGHRAREYAKLTDSDWRDLDALADQHRLRPFLHGRLKRGEIGSVPPAIAGSWQETHRANGIGMLAQRRALLQAVEVLAEEGIAAVALKGSALAWTVWPAPAERIMRDIDLLVGEEEAPVAYAALRRSGWAAPDLPREDLAGMAGSQAHLPPLHSPEGVMCELHAHVWGESPLPGSTMPLADDAGLLSRAAHDEALGAAVPSAEDMLAHLVVHAACSHLLNVGPMALVDIDLWCTQRSVDWDAYWERAAEHGFERPAVLIFALVDRWRRPGFLAQSGAPASPDDDLLEEAEMLLVQDLDARKDVSALASAAAGQFGGRIGQHPLDRAERPSGGLGRAGQLAQRAWSLGRSALDGDTRRDALATARLQKWMEG
ncbi:nucleotidyltransferase family protein [Qipengyuania sp. 1NDW9]|uniref:nucleotidyltransferase domain-containing protein n=1 Tax=Qipengyuania xiapuensis TaxID=2867236 RepID=UPI001C8885DC|nr:nucleotidyltransferase family protein [Qipengyuania xiapuensis]MBX7491844.1 nucleotidyltransferase family protein [Qipengyuania xiapuensis]